MAGFKNDVVFAKNADFSKAGNTSPAESNGLATNGQLWIGSTPLNVGGTHVNVGNITSADGSVLITNGPGTIDLKGISSSHDLHITPFIVSPAGFANGANYTTIQAALNDANSAGGGMVWVQAGTYTENLTFYDKITLIGDSEQTTFIVGTHTPPTSGVLNLFRCTFQGTAAIFSSAAAGTTAIIMEDSAVNVTNGYAFDLLNWVSPGSVAVDDIGPFGTNDGFFRNTGGAGFFSFSAGVGNGTANAMIISGFSIIAGGDIQCPVHFQTGAIFQADNAFFTGALTFLNNSTASFNNCRISTGASAAITMSSSGALKLAHCTIDSSNNPAIAGAGAGTLTYSDLVFLSNSAFAGTLTLATVSWRPYSIALAATDGTKVGTCNFNSAQFTVDTSGFVSTSGTGIGNTITGDSGGALSPTAGNWNILGRSGSKTSGSGSTLTVNSPPFSQVGASATSVLNSGEFVTAAVTRTLPATAGLLDGDLVIYCCTTAGALAVTANTGQTIRIGTLVSSSAGTATSTAIGDSVTLRFNATAVQWQAVGSIGTWVMA